MNETEEISGNIGGSPGEIFLVTFFVPLTSLVLQWISCGAYFPLRLFHYFEVIMLNLTLLLAVTLFSSHLMLLIGVYALVLVLSLWFASRKLSFKEFTLKLKAVDWKQNCLNKSFIGDYRGHLLLATSICILAVDFRVFPSKFAKTETYGWSLMDAGVGSFVLLHGLCSPHGKQSKQSSCKKCLDSSLPLLLLGFIRLIVTSAVGYHKAISEYGTHWNFFFTLALTKTICCSTLALSALSPGVLAAVFLLLHQSSLSVLGLTDLVVSPSRRNILEANKEGLVSLVGFVSLYFSGVQLGRIAWERKQRVGDYLLLLVKMCGLGFSGWLVMHLAHMHVQPISRRMANLPYCIWIVSLTSLQIAVHLCHCLLVAVFKDIQLRENLLWNVLNHNGLFYFLLANLLTGLVNLTTDTAESSTLMALGILAMYLAILFIGSFLLFKSNMEIFSFRASRRKKSL